MMKDSLKVAVDHPDVKILNCSLNTSHKYIRTYYARMYEAKFLSGMIAGHWQKMTGLHILQITRYTE